MSNNPKCKILIVEDDMIIAADISIQLSKHGYEVLGINTRAEDAINSIKNNRPDIVLMDIVLSGQMNGIEAAKIIAEEYKVPVIFLTSNTDDATFEKAVDAKPYAFIAKPFQTTDLHRSIELALKRIVAERQSENQNNQQISRLEDRLFIHHKNQLVKVDITDILFLEAERNYCKVFVAQTEYLVSMPMGTLESQLPSDKFVKVHRSFIVNLDKIDAISNKYEFITIGNQTIPISRRMKEEVVQRIKMV